MILFCSPIGLHYLCNNEKDRFHPNRQRGALRPRDGHGLLCGSLCHNQPLDQELAAAGWSGCGSDKRGAIHHGLETRIRQWI